MLLPTLVPANLSPKATPEECEDANIPPSGPFAKAVFALPNNPVAACGVIPVNPSTNPDPIPPVAAQPIPLIAPIPRISAVPRAVSFPSVRL